MKEVFVHPVFKYNGLKMMDPDNLYIIDSLMWVKGDDPSNIIEVAIKAAQLIPLGFKPQNITEEFESDNDGKHHIYQVGVISHPTFGTFSIAIVGGPDYENIKALFAPIDDIIAEKAQFKLNVHPQHETRQ